MRSARVIALSTANPVALRNYDRLEFLGCLLDRVVLDDIRIMRDNFEFLAGACEPSCNLLIGLGKSVSKPSFQLFHRGRNQEYHHGLGILSLHLSPALDLDFEYHVVSERGFALYVIPWCAILVSGVVGGFQKPSRGPTSLELFGGQKRVIDAIYLTFTLRAGSARDALSYAGAER